MNILERIYTNFHRLLKYSYLKLSNVYFLQKHFVFPNRTVYAVILYSTKCGTMKQFRERNEKLIDFVLYLDNQSITYLNYQTVKLQYQLMLKKQHEEKMKNYFLNELKIDLFTDPEKYGE